MRGRLSITPVTRGAPARAVPLATEATTVLLVEDDAHCRAGLRRHLLQAGLQVCEAANGLEALHLLAHARIHAVATDIRMPTMSGVALIEALMRDHAWLPIVAYSGAQLVDPSLHARLEARGVPLLVKPFPPEQLVLALWDVMKRREA